MDIMTALENISLELSGLQALATLFIDAFATSTDEKTLLLSISTQKSVYLNSANLLFDLIYRIKKETDAAIDAGTKKINQTT